VSDAASPGLAPEAADSLLRAVTGARWFAGKGRRAELRSLTPLPWLDAAPAGPRVRLAVLEVGYPEESGVEHYQLALAYRPASQDAGGTVELFRDGDSRVTDATQDPDAARVLLRALLAGRDVGDETGSGHAGAGAERPPAPVASSVRFHRTEDSALTPDLEPRVFRGEQSNTSVIFGDVAILKLFRRLELGRNLDIQVHAALNEAGTADVARLFGWAEATWTRDGGVLGADLFMCVEKLPDAVDGWDLALRSLRDGTASFAGDAEALGRALAEIHAALRGAFGTTAQPGASVSAVMAARLEAALAVAPALEPYARGLRARFAGLERSELDAQRVHGDFHLGQTLHTPSGWKIIDFEGEPAKTLPERVAPDSVWRDVAGMMRSFDYAAASVPGPDSAAWRDGCREAFLAGYTDGRGLDADDAGLLASYEADKAVYEVVYEVRNRPDWVGIPLGAVAALAQETTGTTSSSITSREGATR
jgi:maltokinase